MKEHLLLSGSVASISLSPSSLAPNRTMLGNTKYLLILSCLTSKLLMKRLALWISLRSLKMVSLSMVSTWMELGGILISRQSMNSCQTSYIVICLIFISLLLSTLSSKKHKKNTTVLSTEHLLGKELFRPLDIPPTLSSTSIYL